MIRSFLIILFGLSLLSFDANAQREIIDKIVAKVGGELVLLSEIEEQHALMQAQQGAIPEDARCLILDNVMSQRLMLNQAKLDSIQITEEEVDVQLDARIERILAYMNGNVSQFEQYYGQSVSEVRAQFREDLRNQILVERMQASIMADVNITPSDFPKVNAEEKQKALDKINDIRTRIIEGGEDFAELAAIFSDDPGSGRAGGDLGWQKRNTFVPEFEAAAYNLENNEYSEIVESEFGFHFIQTLERRGNTIHCRHILVKPAITEADLELAKSKLDTVKNLIEVDSVSFSRAVKLYSSEDTQSYNNDGNIVNPQSGNTFFEIGDLDPDIYFITDTIKVGNISSPVAFQSQTGETAFRLITVKSRTQPHKANLEEDYYKIQKAALESKKGGHINAWIDEKIDSTYIYLENGYNRSCDFMTKWKINP